MKSSLMQADSSAKEYYTIGEVSEMMGVSVEVLRKWERDFPKIVRPMRTKGATRLYRKKDVEKLQMIYRMRHTEGKTISGVQKALGTKQSEEEIKQEVISSLYNIREQLQGIVDQLTQL